MPSLTINMLRIWQYNTINYNATPLIFSGNAIESSGAQDITIVSELGSILDSDDEPPGALRVLPDSEDRACFYLEFSEPQVIYAVILIVQGST